MPVPARIEVYVDGHCAFCRWMEQRVKRFDRHGRVEFLDYNDPTIQPALPFQAQELAAEMHVRGADGDWSKGFFAWLTVMRALPALSWLGWVLARPPLRWLGPPFYRFVARNRYSLPGAPRRCDTSCARHLSGVAVVVGAVLLSFAALAQEPGRSKPADTRSMEQRLAEAWAHVEQRAIELLRQNRIADAKAALEAIVEEQPGNARAKAYLAAAELQSGAVEKAMTRASQLLEADPDNPDLHELLAQAHMQNQDWAQAEKQWRTVLQQRPNSEEARFQLANALLQLGRFPEGLQEVTRAVEINPRRSDARALRGNLLAALGRTLEAAREWRLTLATDANNPAALAGLAVYLREARPDAALEYARRAVELSNWEAVGPIRVLALVHRSRGEPDRAREVLRKALRKFSDNPVLAAELRRLQPAGSPSQPRPRAPGSTGLSAESPSGAQQEAAPQKPSPQ